jgi:hypothetical protein
MILNGWVNGCQIYWANQNNFHINIDSTEILFIRINSFDARFTKDSFCLEISLWFSMCSYFNLTLIFLTIAVKNELEERMGEIKRTAQKVRQKLKGIFFLIYSQSKFFFICTQFIYGFLLYIFLFSKFDFFSTSFKKTCAFKFS